MRSPETSFALGLAFLLILFVGLGSAPLAAAEEFPTETTKIGFTQVQSGYVNIANCWWDNNITRSAHTGIVMDTIAVGVTIDTDYASTPDEVLNRTRIHAKIISPDDDIVFAGFLNEIMLQPTAMPSKFQIQRLQHFTGHLLLEGEYKIIITYDILIGDVWTNVDTPTYFLICTTPLPLPDISTDYLTWRPIMLSFSVIVGMAFIGFNMARRHDPMPALFMMFAGVMLSWSIGWLPTWVFVTAIALISISSAALWGKLFKGR